MSVTWSADYTVITAYIQTTLKASLHIPSCSVHA